ncbi:MAG: hypothetical protein OSJ66_05220 [Clostridia bacterium]|nr:hypothetical protein [Clostridia bacterium]
MAIKHQIVVEKELKKNKACLGEDLVNVIIKSDLKCSKDNARKIISRMTKEGKIKSSRPIKFGNNQYAYVSLKEKCDYETLKDLIARKKPKLFRVIRALKRDNGILTKHELINISGCVSEKKGNNLVYDEIISDLENLSMISKTKYKNIEFICFNYVETEDLITRFEEKIEKLEKENIAYTSTINWLKKINLIQKDDTVYFQGNKNNFYFVKNFTTWDIFGLSNTVGFCNKNIPSTLVLIDFKMCQPYEEIDYEGFYDRVNMCINSTKNEQRKVLPIIVANEISPYVLNKIKKNKYLIFDLNSIIGNNFLNIVDRFHTITKKFENSNTLEIQELSDALELMKTVNQENIGNLKGKLFEYLMYEVFQKIYNEKTDIVKHSKVFPEKNKKYECDIFVETEEEVICIELKAYKTGSVIYLGKFDEELGEYPKDTINWFLNGVVKCCKEIYKSNKRVKYCYITTASFDKDVVKFFSSQKKDVPQKVKCYYEGEELINLLEEHHCKNEVDLIKQFYIT